MTPVPGRRSEAQGMRGDALEIRWAPSADNPCVGPELIAAVRGTAFRGDAAKTGLDARGDVCELFELPSGEDEQPHRGDSHDRGAAWCAVEQGHLPDDRTRP